MLPNKIRFEIDIRRTTDPDNGAKYTIVATPVGGFFWLGRKIVEVHRQGIEIDEGEQEKRIVSAVQELMADILCNFKSPMVRNCFDGKEFNYVDKCKELGVVW